MLLLPLGALLAGGTGVCEPDAAGVLMVVVVEVEGGRGALAVLWLVLYRLAKYIA